MEKKDKQRQPSVVERADGAWVTPIMSGKLELKHRVAKDHKALLVKEINLLRDEQGESRRGKSAHVNMGMPKLKKLMKQVAGDDGSFKPKTEALKAQRGNIISAYGTKQT